MHGNNKFPFLLIRLVVCLKLILQPCHLLVAPLKLAFVLAVKVHAVQRYQTQLAFWKIVSIVSTV